MKDLVGSSGTAGAAAATGVTHRLIGHAIVSADDRIADSAGAYPDDLRNEADWALFQSALDRADLVLLGRTSHDAAPNTRGRRRLIVSSQANGLDQREDGWWLNPAAIALADALATLLPCGGEVAVPGGQGVFDLVGASGFAEFHLARNPAVILPHGRGLFAACETGTPAAKILANGGLGATPPRIIDTAAKVDLTIWRR
ncbi:hypothetical protein RDV64_11190 [Acuticoccus sp. MNP-M23]|uniref:hypothetical protein n=1 Tax=Acuticoccus sp. MNP-M23 TaxID=3072793 RepID=UPI00281630A5|nr:hypothetical protein [Acuticoccus sp. MNP-M23]WMS44911.1 hypothetical protein RDV64_11190 [Acuticoccus sp. MNP-M23]